MHECESIPKAAGRDMTAAVVPQLTASSQSIHIDSCAAIAEKMPCGQDVTKNADSYDDPENHSDQFSCL